MYWIVFQYFIQKYYTWQNDAFLCGIIGTKKHDADGAAGGGGGGYAERSIK